MPADGRIVTVEEDSSLFFIYTEQIKVAKADHNRTCLYAMFLQLMLKWAKITIDDKCQLL